MKSKTYKSFISIYRRNKTQTKINNKSIIEDRIEECACACFSDGERVSNRFNK